jgi:hypothetical protein
VRRLLKQIVPTAWRPPAIAERLRGRWAQSDLVKAGPFAGMRFTWHDWNPDFSAPFPKIMGTYELELHPIVEKIVALAPRRIVEVGAADGYYAIGFARRIPSTEIIAFEALPSGRELLTTLASANHVLDRIQVRGRCEIDDLRDTLSGDDVLMLDVEGYEHTLLDLGAIPTLATTTILVESHDFHVTGMTELLRSRFRDSHRITTITSRKRNLADLGSVSWLVKSYCKYNLLGWVNERVGALTTWLFLEPKATMPTPVQSATVP